MCGIAGILGTTDADAGVARVSRMLDTIVHRGPDDSGTCAGDRVALGVRRLKIIDLAGGHQPMSSEDGQVWVVFNGEIYNHAKIRQELAARGHRFRTRCDTEVLVHGWEEYGEAVVDHLQGMFAFAIWDGRTRTLFLARDRLGIKPLYYAWNGSRLVFGSEIKAVLASGLVDREVDLQSLYHYIGFEFVPAPATMFRDVRKIPAGHCLTVSDGTLTTRPYWDVSYEPADISEAEAIGGVRQLLAEAVEKRLMSEVPLGVFLSGGLDSTAVLALVRQATDKRVPTFTIGYRDASFSEWEYARRAATYYGTDHHEIVIDPVTPELIEASVWHLDEPMTDLSAIPLYLLCRQARRHATVCLSGEGGDEVFVGYDRFIAAKLDHLFYSRVPGALRRGVIEPLVGRLADRPQKKGAVNLLKRFVEGAALPPEGEHMRWQFFSSARQDADLFTPAFLASIDPSPFAPVARHAGRVNGVDRLARQCYVDLRLTMPDSVLMKVDKMSMAHSVEVRVPFLDHALVEFAARVPSDLKFPAIRAKALYRKAMTGVLPPFILSRGKQGYSLPLKNWLRDELRGYMQASIDGSPLIRRHFNVPFIHTLIDQHLKRTHNHNHVLWALMNLAIWHRRFIESPAPWSSPSPVEAREMV
jgi:asparagine synthase (glutamine-hydrolysing)